MGQRHQIFIRIHNPLNNPEVIKDLCTFDKKQKALKHAKAVFGEKKTSILAFHNQWLYGMSAAATCANIMREVYKSDRPEHIFSKELDRLPYPVNYTHTSNDEDKVDGYFQLIQTLLFNLFDTDFAAHGSRYGLERVINLVDECYDRKTGKFDKRWDIRSDFRRGDNNDGITIIDLVNKKYCFMNIFDERDEKNNGVYYLTPLTPASAEEYVNAYYPVERERVSEYDIERCKKDEEKIKEMLDNRKENLNFVKEVFSKYEVLSLDEVKKICPAIYRVKKVKENK